jgi:predicted pyridoxine 5'-phosphate oxidase superfamily flavin-nucleotide-binding protein
MWQEDIDNIPQSDSELESDNDDNSSSIEDNDDGDDDAQRKSSQPKIQDEHMETQETAALNEETKEPATPNEQKTLEDATNEQPAASSTTKEINASQTVKRNLTTKRKRHEKEQITPRTSARTANKPGDTEITKPRHQVEHNPQARKYTKRTNCTSRYENRRDKSFFIKYTIRYRKHTALVFSTSQVTRRRFNNLCTQRTGMCTLWFHIREQSKQQEHEQQRNCRYWPDEYTEYNPNRQTWTDRHQFDQEKVEMMLKEHPDKYQVYTQTIDLCENALVGPFDFGRPQTLPNRKRTELHSRTGKS